MNKKKSMEKYVRFICKKLEQANNQKYEITRDGFLDKFVAAYKIVERNSEKEKLLVYGEVESGTIYAKLNNRDLISLCESVVRKTKNSKYKLHFALDYNSFACC
ncbi:MAG: hypothetical protein M1416_02955 [Candidatus Pacearchaeota archaeon]|nr:hypothetical protein [Candidatus Pacearchaeota archaeon]